MVPWRRDDPVEAERGDDGKAMRGLRTAKTMRNVIKIEEKTITSREPLWLVRVWDKWGPKGG